MTDNIVNQIFERLKNNDNLLNIIKWNSETETNVIELWRSYRLNDYRQFINSNSIIEAYKFFDNYKESKYIDLISDIVKGVLAELNIVHVENTVSDFFNTYVQSNLTFDRFMVLIKDFNMYVDTELIINELDFKDFCKDLKLSKSIYKCIIKYSKSSLKYIFYDILDEFGTLFYDNNCNGFVDFINNTYGETTIVLKYKLPIYAILAIKYKLEELDFIRGCYDYDFELWVGNRYLILPHYFNSIQISKLNPKIRVLNAEVLHNKIYPTVDIKYKGKLLV